MSSELTASTQNLELAPLHGPQTVPSTPAEKKINENQRNESAARGQNLPPEEAQQERDAQAEVEQVETAVSQISDFVQNFQRDLLFSIDEDSDRLVVKVVDSETQEVIRQIPSEETLRIARNLDSSESLILKEQA